MRCGDNLGGTDWVPYDGTQHGSPVMFLWTTCVSATKGFFQHIRMNLLESLEPLILTEYHFVG